MEQFRRQVVISIWLMGIIFVFIQPVEAQVKTYEISLEDAVKLAIKNNFEIQLAKYDTWIARTDQGVAKSIYDTVFDANVSYREDRQARTSTILGTRNVDNDYNFGLTKKLPSGTTLSAQMTNNRNLTDSSFATSPVTHESTFSIGLIQELGQNFFGIQDRGGIKLVDLDIANWEYLSLDSIEASIAEVQKSYWDLAAQHQFLKFQQNMVEQAKRLYDTQTEKLNSGVSEIPDVIASEANYRERLNNLLLTQSNFELGVNRLKLLLNIDSDEVNIIPVSEFLNKDKMFSLVEALNIAFKNRRDYKRKTNDLKGADIELSMSKNSLWPRISVSATLARNGLGDDFRDSSESITDEDNPDFYTGIEIHMPLENTQARANYSRADYQKSKDILLMKYLERKIFLAVTDRIREVEVYREVASNAKRVAALHNQKLQEEEKRFKFGRSNIDTIIRFQQDLLDAEQKNINVQNEYQRKLIDLELELGNLLEEYWDEEI